MRPTQLSDTPPWGAVPKGVIDLSLDLLDQQRSALMENGATSSARLVARVRDRLATKTKQKDATLDWTSVPDAADRLGISEPTVVRWIAAGRLRGQKVGGRYIVYQDGISTELDNSREGEQEDNHD